MLAHIKSSITGQSLTIPIQSTIEFGNMSWNEQKNVEYILGEPTRYEVNNLINMTWEQRDGTTFFLRYSNC